MNQAVVDRFRAEAYFCRACKYADLVCYYGDVPWVDRLMTIDESRQRTRMPKAELMPKIYEDFDLSLIHI